MNYKIVDLFDSNNHEKKKWEEDVIIIFSNEWEKRKEQIQNLISSRSGELQNKINARDCTVREINSAVAKEFLEKYHIQGSNNLSLIYFGLFLSEELISVMTLGRHSRQISQNRIVLDRYCVKSNICVRGGASKLFKKCIEWAKDRKYDEIISFSDNRFGNGDIYKILGFTLEKEHKADYFYFDPNRNSVFSKQSQKKSSSKCPKELTEFEWASQRGLVKIWDKGKKRWVYYLKPNAVSWKQKLSEKCANQNKNGDFKQSHVRGYFNSIKNNCKIYYGSSYELRCIFLLEENSEVLSFKRGDCFLDTKGHYRNPDILAKYKNNITKIIEIKPESRLGEKDVIDQIEESKKYSEKNGYIFEIWTEKNAGLNDSKKIINWAKKYLAENGNFEWIKKSKENNRIKAKKYYYKKIFTDKVNVFCEYCNETHQVLNKSYKSNIARNNRYICEKEGGHISGSKPKFHLRKENPHKNEGKKQCNNCKNIKLFEDFNSDKSKKDGLYTICKKCVSYKQKEKYKNK